MPISSPLAETSAPTLSFELMPPRTPAGEERFWHTVAALEATFPDFVSVTYGAGGHNRDTAHAVTARIVREAPVRPLAHLTCVDASREETLRVIDDYLNSGVRAFLALRGDQPQPTPGRENTGPCEGELKSSIELIALLRARDRARCERSNANSLRTAIHPLIIAVATFPAGNPAAQTTPTQEVERLLIKQAAGANFAITQLFYHPEIYTSFVNEARAAGVEIPILAGILPPTHPQRLRRVAELTGVEPDQDLLHALEEADDDQRLEIGIAAGAHLVEQILAAGAPGVHIYTFNQAHPTLEVLERAGLIGAGSPPHLWPRRSEWTHDQSLHDVLQTPPAPSLLPESPAPTASVASPPQSSPS